MNIPLDEGYRLSSDSRQWMIQKRKDRKNRDTGEPEIEWLSLNYHPTPEAAIRHHAHMRVREQEAETLGAALEKIDRVLAELTRALAPHFEIKRGQIDE